MFSKEKTPEPISPYQQSIDLFLKDLVDRSPSDNSFLVDILRQSDFFKNRLRLCDPHEHLLHQSLRFWKCSHYPKGSFILHSGEDIDGLYFVLEGVVNCYQLKTEKEMQNEVVTKEEEKKQTESATTRKKRIKTKLAIFQIMGGKALRGAMERNSILVPSTNAASSPRLEMTRSRRNTTVAGEIEAESQAEFDAKQAAIFSKLPKLRDKYYSGDIMKYKLKKAVKAGDCIADRRIEVTSLTSPLVAWTDVHLVFISFSMFYQLFGTILEERKEKIQFFENLFPNVEKERLKNFGSDFSRAVYKQNQRIYGLSDPVQAMYFVKKGSVLLRYTKHNIPSPTKTRDSHNPKSRSRSPKKTLSIASPTRKREENVIAVLGEGKFFGEERLLDLKYRSFEATAEVNQCELYVLSEEDIDRYRNLLKYNLRKDIEFRQEWRTEEVLHHAEYKANMYRIDANGFRVFNSITNNNNPGSTNLLDQLEFEPIVSQRNDYQSYQKFFRPRKEVNADSQVFSIDPQSAGSFHRHDHQGSAFRDSQLSTVRGDLQSTTRDAPQSSTTRGELPSSIMRALRGDPHSSTMRDEPQSSILKGDHYSTMKGDHFSTANSEHPSILRGNPPPVREVILPSTIKSDAQTSTRNDHPTALKSFTSKVEGQVLTFKLDDSQGSSRIGAGSRINTQTSNPRFDTHISTQETPKSKPKRYLVDPSYNKLRIDPFGFTAELQAMSGVNSTNPTSLNTKSFQDAEKPVDPSNSFLLKLKKSQPPTNPKNNALNAQTRDKISSKATKAFHLPNLEQPSSAQNETIPEYEKPAKSKFKHDRNSPSPSLSPNLSPLSRFQPHFMGKYSSVNSLDIDQTLTIKKIDTARDKLARSTHDIADLPLAVDKKFRETVGLVFKGQRPLKSRANVNPVAMLIKNASKKGISKSGLGLGGGNPSPKWGNTKLVDDIKQKIFTQRPVTNPGTKLIDNLFKRKEEAD